MMKTKFFKGISVAFTLAMVAIATTFTSCEKEEFNVDVKPANAQAVISPLVLFVDVTGNVSDVTNDGNVTLTPAAKDLVFVGNPNLEGKTVQVTASYSKDGEVYEATINVQVPALLAGQFANITPTIMLKEKNAPVEFVTETGTPVASQEDKVAHVDNKTDYWWSNTTRHYVVKSGQKLATNGIAFEEGISNEAKSYIVNYAATIQNTYKEETKVVTFNVYSISRTTLELNYNIKTTTATFKMKGATKADVKIGTVKTENYSTTEIKVTENQVLPNHDATHGYGHGHGNDSNAGGGIIWAD